MPQKYRVIFKPRAVKDLECLHPDAAERILAKVEALGMGLTPAVKRLTNFSPEYRLRVGDYRVLFEIEGDSLSVYRVVHRKQAYRS